LQAYVVTVLLQNKFNNSNNNIHLLKEYSDAQLPVKQVTDTAYTGSQVVKAKYVP
jgi:hypothetical protein